MQKASPSYHLPVTPLEDHRPNLPHRHAQGLSLNMGVEEPADLARKVKSNNKSIVLAAMPTGAARFSSGVQLPRGLPSHYFSVEPPGGPS
ncbi:hypothetical protein E2C01_061071 [Portunus trituberculatus]|uniref:Uncharacterized protein n=1 Tax=Portunus trituberculatus TaxID=210409 RepID=A0A5B7HBA5_PORTR|nr:hypothetical protein [Portunus trituberculatus]